jgi:putative aminopeptidase FrvX
MQQVVLRHRDANGFFAPKLTTELEDKCQAMGISYSYKDAYIETLNREQGKTYSLGRTELGRLVTASNGEINGTTLQIPSTNYHTPDETAALDAIAAVRHLLMSFIA